MYKKTKFKWEILLHRLTEKYIKTGQLFDLEVVASEIQVTNEKEEDGRKNKPLRMDTLAFDKKEKAFVIIEYKIRKNDSVIPQVQGYYKLLKDNPEKYAERVDETEDEIEFENTRAIIIGPEFTQEQIEDSEKLDYLELYTYSLYKCDGGKHCILYEKVNSDFKKRFTNIESNDLELTIDDVLNDKSSDIKKLYNNFEYNLRKKFDELDMSDKLDIIYLVDAVSIKAHNNPICNVNVKESIKIYFYTHRLNKINKMLDKHNCRKKNLRNIAYLTTGGPSAYFELTLTPKDMGYAIDRIKEIDDAKREGKND